MKTKNIDLSMVHFDIADKNGEILINTDKLIKQGYYNQVVPLILEGYEPDIQQDAIIYANKLDDSDRLELIQIKELMNERLRLCILRDDKKYIDLYTNLIKLVEERILNFTDASAEKYKQVSEHLPKELNTPEAREIFEKAIEAGFMNNDYCFIGNGNQKALFAGLANDKLGITTEQWRDGKMVEVKSWKPFEQLWNVKGLADKWKKIMNYKTEVKDSEKIKNIFI